jgi:hypothetical protein
MAKVYRSKTRIEFFIIFRPRSSVPPFPEFWEAVQVPLAKGAHGMNSHELAVLVKGQCHISRAQLYGRRGAIRPLI